MGDSKTINLVGIPVQDGARRLGCEMGPSAYRTAGIIKMLQELGHKVNDTGNITPTSTPKLAKQHSNQSLYQLEKVTSWISVIEKTAFEQMHGGFPVFMGGDHIMSAGTVSGVARYAAEVNKPLFVLWLDTHSDFHRLDSTDSGNLHGTPVAYFSGQPGFENYYPSLKHVVAEENICMLGLRSVDPAEREALQKSKITYHDMRAIDEYGVGTLLSRFLEKVKEADGLLHVSLDVDFLDPTIAPAVGTAVEGGVTYREAHLIMEMLHDSGLPTSLDLAELNLFLDENGRTAKLMTALAASLFGQDIIDSKRRSF